METAVVLLESVLPSLLDPAVLEGQGPGFKESLVGLLQPLLGLRYTDPVMVALVSGSGFRARGFGPGPEGLVGGCGGWSWPAGGEAV